MSKDGLQRIGSSIGGSVATVRTFVRYALQISLPEFLGLYRVRYTVF